jgi:hypothetical protein
MSNFKWLCAKSSFLPRVIGYGVYIMICFVVFGRLVYIGLNLFNFFSGPNDSSSITFFIVVPVLN